MKSLMWGVGLAACLALATLLIALHSQGKAPLDPSSAQAPRGGGPKRIFILGNGTVNSTQQEQPESKLGPNVSRTMQGLTDPSKPSSNQIDLYSFYAQVWGMLHPVAALWHISWADLFEGTSTVLPRSENVHGLDAGDEASSSSDLNLVQLVNCWNEKHAHKDMDWSAVMKDDLAALKVVAAFWSKGHEHSTSSVSLVTTANMARLDQLRAQCLAWEGPLSVALHYPVLQDEAKNFTTESSKEIREAILQISKLVAEMQRQPTACKLRVMLTAEIVTERRAMMLFPVNTLRNLARLQAETPLIALLDVDLLPSKSLYTRTKDAVQSQKLIEQAKDTVFVVPGFEVEKVYEHAPWADALASGNKDMVVMAYNQQVLVPFHIQRYPAGHGPTQYPKWVNATADYLVTYEDGYEPWLIGSRLGMPWHDERYRGFGKNKVQHILNLCLLSFKFKVLHDSYAVHRPHDLSSSAVTFLTKTDRKSGQKNELKAHMSELLDWQEAAGMSFKPVLTGQTRRCMSKLSWWQLSGVQQQQQPQQQQLPLSDPGTGSSSTSAPSTTDSTSGTGQQQPQDKQHVTIVIGQGRWRARLRQQRPTGLLGFFMRGR